MEVLSKGHTADFDFGELPVLPSCHRKGDNVKRLVLIGQPGMQGGVLVEIVVPERSKRASFSDFQCLVGEQTDLSTWSPILNWFAFSVSSTRSLTSFAYWAEMIWCSCSLVAHAAVCGVA